MSAPTVSVILPVFNGGEELRLAVASIHAQSFADWELILLDDGSKDGALERLGVSADPRLRIVRDGQNRGLSARLNQGVALARGRYIARMDHDDIAHPDRLSRQVEFLDGAPDVDLCGTRCVAMDEDGAIIGALPVALTHEQICARPWRGFHLAHPTWMGRAGWFRDHPYTDPGPYRCEDQDLLLRTYLSSRFAALPEALLAYRVRANPRLSVLAKTRVALAREQWAHFLSQGAVAKGILSLALAAVRIGSDTIRNATGSRAPVRADTSLAERQEWSRIVDRLRGPPIRTS